MDAPLDGACASSLEWIIMNDKRSARPSMITQERPWEGKRRNCRSAEALVVGMRPIEFMGAAGVAGAGNPVFVTDAGLVDLGAPPDQLARALPPFSVRSKPGSWLHRDAHDP
jgi:hypothetical protein